MSVTLELRGVGCVCLVGGRVGTGVERGGGVNGAWALCNSLMREVIPSLVNVPEITTLSRVNIVADALRRVLTFSFGLACCCALEECKHS